MATITATLPKRWTPDYVCDSCGSQHVLQDDIQVCNACGKASDFSEKPLIWFEDGYEQQGVEHRCLRCNESTAYDDYATTKQMVWHCEDCGHVGEPHDLGRDRWESSEGL